MAGVGPSFKTVAAEGGRRSRGGPRASGLQRCLGRRCRDGCHRPKALRGQRETHQGTSGGQTSPTQVGAAGGTGIVSCPWREFPRTQRVGTFRHWGQTTLKVTLGFQVHRMQDDGADGHRRGGHRRLGRALRRPGALQGAPLPAQASLACGLLKQTRSREDSGPRGSGWMVPLAFPGQTGRERHAAVQSGLPRARGASSGGAASSGIQRPGVESSPTTS